METVGIRSMNVSQTWVIWPSISPLGFKVDVCHFVGTGTLTTEDSSENIKFMKISLPIDHNRACVLISEGLPLSKPPLPISHRRHLLMSVRIPFCAGCVFGSSFLFSICWRELVVAKISSNSARGRLPEGRKDPG